MPSSSLYPPGTSGNPNGRPSGTRNKRTTELWDLLQKRGDRDPVEFMSQLVTDGTIPLEVRLQAANNIAPYRHSKCAATPPPRYIEKPFKLPHPQPATLDQIMANISHINQTFALGKLELDFYNALLTGQRQHIETFKARGDESFNEQIIRIVGGLPDLPGTNISMPLLNGRATLTLDAIPPTPDPAPDPEADQ